MITKHQSDSHNGRLMITKHHPNYTTLLIHSIVVFLNALYPQSSCTHQALYSQGICTHNSLTLSQVTFPCTTSAYGWFNFINALMRCQHAMLQELRFITHTQTSIKHFIKQLMCTMKLYYSNDSKTFLNHPKWGKTPSQSHKTCQRKHFQIGFHNTPSIPSQTTLPTQQLISHICKK